MNENNFIKLFSRHEVAHAKKIKNHVTNNDTMLARKFIKNHGYNPNNPDNADILKTEIIKRRTNIPGANAAARKIQKAIIKRYKLKDNINYLNKQKIVKFLSDSNNNKLNKYAKAHGFKNINNLSNHYKFLRQKVLRYKKNGVSRNYSNKLSHIKTIQQKYRDYINKRKIIIYNYINDLLKDGRFDYNAKMLEKLFTQINLIPLSLGPGMNSKEKITTFIGPCHIEPKEVPIRYLTRMFNQMKYTATEYSKMTPVKRTMYRDRLSKELGNRPCLENLLDGMVISIVPPAFEWRGKSVEPLYVKNKKYLTKVIGPAISSWHSTLSNNNKKVIANKNLNARKKLFWNMIKNQELQVMTNNGPMYLRSQVYNVNGKRFKSSEEAAQLEYF